MSEFPRFYGEAHNKKQYDKFSTLNIWKPRRILLYKICYWISNL